MALPQAHSTVAKAVLLILSVWLITHRSVNAEEPSPIGHDHQRHDQHRIATSRADTLLTEPGQGAFAALAEAVTALMANPDTDWSLVDLAALREHLVSMDRLVLDATVVAEQVQDGVRFTITGQGRTRRAIQEMVPAHAAVLNESTDWRLTATEDPSGTTLVVTSDDPAERLRMRALGFFGLMAMGEHHRSHHWAIASGRRSNAH